MHSTTRHNANNMDTNPHNERQKCKKEEGMKEKLEPKDDDMETD